MSKIEEHQWKDGSSTREIYSESGQLLRLEDRTPTGDLKLSVDYRYDDRENNIERIVCNSQGILIRRLEFEFDENGKERLCREFDESNHLVRKK